MSALKIEEIRSKLTVPQVRSMSISRDVVYDDLNRTVQLAFASETPCESWFGDLILSMGKGNVRTDRLEAGLALLLDHDRTQQVGIIDSFEFGTDGIARAMARFSRSDEGDEVFQDVKDGIRRGVSVGFMVYELHLESQTDGENDLYRSDDWEPIEISLVSIPADISVGVGRSANFDKQVQIPPSPVTRAISEPETTNMLTAEEIAAAAAENTRTAAPAPVVDTRSDEAKLVQRKKDIIAYGEVFGEGDLARTMTLGSNDITVDDVRAAIQAKQKPSTDIPLADPNYQPAQVRQRMSLGEHLVRSEDYKRAEKGRGKRISIAVDTDIQTRATFSGLGTGLTDYDRQPGIVMVGQQRLTVADLLAQGQTNSPVVRYVQETSYTNAATTVAEGATKPEATFDLNEVDAPVRKVAVTAKVTDETIEDFAEVRSYIDNRLTFMVQQTEESQLINGSGSGANITGLLNTSGIQTQSKSTDAMEVAIYKAMTKVRTIGFFDPDAIVINPADYQGLRLAKDSAGQYFGGGPFSGMYGNGGFIENPPLWGLRVVVTTAIAAGTPLIGAFKIGAQVFFRNGLAIDMTNSNEDDFKKNLVAIRAEQRMALAVYRPLAFCEVVA